MGLHTKQRTNVSIDARLLKEARRAGIRLSPLLEEAIRSYLREQEAERWLKENAAAIDHYNKEIGGHGVFSEGLRRF
jgi:antitoxin CcdA